MGYAHRDIKPDNLLLDAQGHIKVANTNISCQSDHTCDSSPILERVQSLEPTALYAGQLLPSARPTTYRPRSVSSLYWQRRLTRVAAGSRVSGWAWQLHQDVRLLGRRHLHIRVSVRVCCVCCHHNLPLTHDSDTPFYAETLLGTYSKIMNHKPETLKFPDEPKISAHAQDVIRRLLTRADKRLGSGPTGIQEIKNHPFFEVNRSFKSAQLTSSYSGDRLGKPASTCRACCA